MGHILASPKQPSKRIPGLLPSEREKLDEPPDPGSDSGALETLQLSSGLTQKQIEQRAKEAEANRTEGFRDHFETLSRVALWLVFGALVAIAIVWLLHLILPERWRWLTKEQVATIQNIVTGGVVAGVATAHLRRRLQ